MKFIACVPAEDRGGLKVNDFEAGEKFAQEGIDVKDIVHTSDSGSVMVGST